MLLTQDQEMIRDAVRAFAQEELWPHAPQWDRDRHFPHEAHRGLAALGAYGICVPEAYGGANLDYVTLALVLEEIAAGDGGTSTAISVTNCPVNAILMRYGSEAQKKSWLTRLAQGELLGLFCLTEPHVGSDASALKTSAVKDADGYVINGVKQFITSGKNGQVAIVIAVTDKGAGKKGMSAFLVPTDTPGYVVARLEEKIGQHSSDTAQINFDNCRIPAENLIGEEGKGFRYILDGMNAERLLIASECIGDAKWFTAKSVAYANDRRVFNRPIGQNQGIQFPIARAYAQMRAAELLVREGCDKFDSGQHCGEEANMAKMLAAEASWAAAEACVQTHGGFGFAEEYDVERKFRETRLYQVAPISTNLILSYLAEHVLGMPRSY